MLSRDRRDDATPGRQSGRESFAVVRVTGGGPPLGRWAGLIVVLLALAIAKPWDGPSQVIPSAPVTRDSARGGPMSQPQATVDPVSPGSAVADICLNPASWRIATVERWRDQTIRVWRAIVPRTTATGPGDDRVPITSLVSEGVIELGWCAPVLGARIAGNADVEVWRRTAVGVSPVTMTSQRPGPDTSPYGALYGSPAAAVSAASVVTLWNDGTYVFRQRAPNGEESWFGVDLERRPSTGTRG